MIGHGIELEIDSVGFDEKQGAFLLLPIAMEIIILGKESIDASICTGDGVLFAQ